MGDDPYNYNDTQAILRGNWKCEVDLRKSSWNQESENRLREYITWGEKELTVTVLMNPYYERLDGYLAKKTLQLSEDFALLDTDMKPLAPPDSNVINKKDVCVKVR